MCIFDPSLPSLRDKVNVDENERTGTAEMVFNRKRKGPQAVRKGHFDNRTSCVRD